MEFSGGEVDAAQVGIRRICFEPVGTRTHHATIEDEALQRKLRAARGRPGVALSEAILEVLQDLHLFRRERGLETIGKADQEPFSLDSRGPRHDADRATRVHERVVRPPHCGKGNDLGSSRDVEWLVRHSREGLTNAHGPVRVDNGTGKPDQKATRVLTERLTISELRDPTPASPSRFSAFHDGSIPAGRGLRFAPRAAVSALLRGYGFAALYPHPVPHDENPRQPCCALAVRVASAAWQSQCMRPSSDAAPRRARPRKPAVDTLPSAGTKTWLSRGEECRSGGFSYGWTEEVWVRCNGTYWC